MSASGEMEQRWWEVDSKGLYANNMAMEQVYNGMILVYHWTTWMEGLSYVRLIAACSWSCLSG